MGFRVGIMEKKMEATILSIILGVYIVVDDGKENANYYLGLRGLGFLFRVYGVYGLGCKIQGLGFRA